MDGAVHTEPIYGEYTQLEAHAAAFEARALIVHVCQQVDGTRRLQQGVSPVPAQMWQGVSQVPAQMWQGVSPVPAQTSARTRCDTVCHVATCYAMLQPVRRGGGAHARRAKAEEDVMVVVFVPVRDAPH